MRVSTTIARFLAGSALLVLGAAAPALADDDAAANEAADIYKARCATCHGDAGKGDGAAAAALNPKPRDLRTKEWQASVTDEHIEKVIVSGGPAVNMSPLMPPNPDLAGKPAVVQALVKKIRAFGAE